MSFSIYNKLIDRKFNFKKIMGHNNCGCIESLIADDDEDDNLFITIFKHNILNLNKNIKINKNDSKIIQRKLEEDIVSASLFNLFSYPWIKSKYINCGLNVNGLFLDLG